MRSLFSSCLLAALLALPAHRTSAQLGVHVFGGLSHATVLPDENVPDVDYGRVTGLHAGAGVEFPLSGPLGLRIDGSWTDKGASADLTLEGIAIKTTFELSYVEVAPSITFGTDMAYALAGPWVAFQTRCSVEAAAAGQSHSSSCTVADVEELATVDFGVAGGIGAQCALPGNWRLGAEVLYSIGLLDMSPGEDGTDRNTSLRGRAFIGLPIG